MSSDDARGSYANTLVVRNTKEEFVTDFLFSCPPAGGVAHRIITSPGNQKRMVKALMESIEMYESDYGPIDPTEEPDFEIGFQP